MIWKRLKENKCPRCVSYLMPSSDRSGVYNGVTKCSSKTCDFAIGTDKFDDMINDMYRPKKERRYDDNLSALNNL